MSMFNNQRSRDEYKAFLEEHQREQVELAERLEAPLRIRKLEQEMDATARKLHEVQRERILGYEEKPYIPDDLATNPPRFNSDEEFMNWYRGEALAFYMECKPMGWSGSPADIDTLTSYLNRWGIGPGCGFPYCDRRVFKAAFLSLRSSGLFDVDEPVQPGVRAAEKKQSQPKPEPELPRLPLGHQRPIAHRREAEPVLKGIDPETGLERQYTQLEVDLMPADLYKKVFRVDGRSLTKANFGRW